MGAAARATEVDSAMEALDFETEPPHAVVSARLRLPARPGDVAGCSQRTGLTCLQHIARGGGFEGGPERTGVCHHQPDDRDRPRPPARHSRDRRRHRAARRRSHPAHGLLLAVERIGHTVDARPGASASEGLAGAPGRTARSGQPDPLRGSAGAARAPGRSAGLSAGDQQVGLVVRAVPGRAHDLPARLHLARTGGRVHRHRLGRGEPHRRSRVSARAARGIPELLRPERTAGRR